MPIYDCVHSTMYLLLLPPLSSPHAAIVKYNIHIEELCSMYSWKLCWGSKCMYLCLCVCSLFFRPVPIVLIFEHFFIFFCCFFAKYIELIENNEKKKKIKKNTTEPFPSHGINIARRHSITIQWIFQQTTPKFFNRFKFLLVPLFAFAPAIDKIKNLA